MAGFEVLNAPGSENNAATYVEQARLDSGDFSVLAAGQAGTGVLSGCAVGASGFSLVIGMSSPAVVRTAVEASSYPTNTEIIFTVPTEAQVGDLLLVSMSGLGSGADTFGAPSGWTSVVSGNSSSSVNFVDNVAVYSRTAQAGDAGSSFSFSFTENGGQLTGILAVCETAGIASSAIVTNDATTSITSTAPTITSGQTVLSFATSMKYQAGGATTGAPTYSGSGTTVLAVVGKDAPFGGQTLVSNSTAEAETFSLSVESNVAIITVVLESVPTTENIVVFNTEQVSVGTGDLTVSAADSTFDRVDLVVVNSSGTSSLVQGTPAATPSWPTIPAGSVVLAAVTVPAGSTSLSAANVIDKRVLIPTPVVGNVPSVASSAPSAATTGFYFDTTLNKLGISDGAYWHYYTETSNTVPLADPYRDGASVYFNSSTNSVSLTIPSDVQVGDYLLLCGVTASSVSISGGSGNPWPELHAGSTALDQANYNGSGGATRMSLFGRLAAAGDAGASLTISSDNTNHGGFASGEGGAWVIVGYYGSPAPEFDIAAEHDNDGESSTPNPFTGPTLTTTGSLDRVIHFIASYGGGTISEESGTTQRVYANESATGDVSLLVCDYEQSGAAAITPAQVSQATPTGSSLLVYTVALKQA